MQFWKALIDSPGIDTRFAFSTVDTTVFPVVRDASVAKATYHGSAAATTIDLSSVKSLSRKPPWPTNSATTWPRQFFELGLLADLDSRDSWGEGHNHWLACVAPCSEPVLIRRHTEDPHDDEPWRLILGTFEDECVLAWPVVLIGTFGDDGFTFFQPAIDCATVERIYIYDCHWDFWACVWASPWDQRALYAAPFGFEGSGAKLRLVAQKHPDNFLVVAADECFWKMSATNLFKLAEFLKLPGISKTSSEVQVLMGLIQRLKPGISDEDLYYIMLKRAPKHRDLDVFEDEDILDFLPEKDHKEFEEEREKLKAEDRRRRQYLHQLAPLREAVRVLEQERETGLSSDARLYGFRLAEASSWTEERMNALAPHKSHMHCDFKYSRWRIKWRWGTLSRSWALHGYEEAAKMCLAAAWRSVTYHTGVVCPIPGILSDEGVPVGAALEPVPGPMPAARGRGRGGRRGRGRRGAPFAAPVPPEAEGPEPPAVEGEEVYSTSSDSSSSSSSDSSSDSGG